MNNLHPEIQNFINLFDMGLASIGLTDLPTDDIPTLRNTLGVPFPEEMLPSIHSIENRTIPGPEGDIPIRIYRPSDAEKLPVLIWFHGGGWVLHSVENGELTCRKFANDVECVVVSVDYRLAPETPYPGAIDDCAAATTWVAESAAELGIDPTRIAVAGDSAGGNLAACVAYRARENGPELVFQLLIYPVTDANFDRPSYLDNAEGYLLTRHAMQWFWDCYVPDHAQRTEPDAAPLQADDLSGLPPAHIITAEFDPLRDEGEAYGAALQAAGVEVETLRYDGMAHAFFNLMTAEPVDQVIAATENATAALRRAFGN